MNLATVGDELIKTLKVQYLKRFSSSTKQQELQQVIALDPAEAMLAVDHVLAVAHFQVAAYRCHCLPLVPLVSLPVTACRCLTLPWVR